VRAVFSIPLFSPRGRAFERIAQHSGVLKWVLDRQLHLSFFFFSFLFPKGFLKNRIPPFPSLGHGARQEAIRGSAASPNFGAERLSLFPFSTADG